MELEDVDDSWPGPPPRDMRFSAFACDGAEKASLAPLKRLPFASWSSTFTVAPEVL